MRLSAKAAKSALVAVAACLQKETAVMNDMVEQSVRRQLAELRACYPKNWHELVEAFDPPALEEHILQNKKLPLVPERAKECIGLAANIAAHLTGELSAKAASLHEAAKDANVYVAAASIVNILIRKVRSPRCLGVF